jgi:hypothetical protein
LKAGTIELLHTPLRLSSGATADFALGWKVERVQLAGETARMVAHRANAMGGTAALLMFPDHRLVVAAVSNVTRADGVAPFGMKVADAFARTKKNATSGRSFATAMAQAYRAANDASGQLRFPAGADAVALAQARSRPVR